MNRSLVIIILSFIFINRAIVGMAADVSVPGKTEVNIDQTSELTQNQTTYGSTSSSNLVYSPTTINQRGFSGGAQPQFPGSVGYGGPWKESWNIISTDMYKLLETFWPATEAKKTCKRGEKTKALYWEIPYRGGHLTLPPSEGVNVIFKTNEETALPPSAVPVGVMTVKGGEKTVIWQLVARAVLEARERGASWLNIENYNYSPLVKSSSFGLGLAATGAGINNGGDLSGVSGGGTGWARAKAGPITEPFIHAVAYVLFDDLKATAKESKKEEIKEKVVSAFTAQAQMTLSQRPKIELGGVGKSAAFKMVVRIQPDPEKKVVHVSLKNISKKSAYISPTYFRLETKDGQRHSFSLDTYAYPSCFWVKQLEPDEEISGFLLFKTDEPSQRLIYDDMNLMAASWNFN